uniref:glutamate dehydrogenase (NADP(+)) n=1 Tax=Trieres chinensis TaxID=1514140 RepID=A0A7S2AB97_TRICV|mmetsp:Transcript_9802/g.20729  ORF Transcript_9802/g.20729 Transcript_9802/m.20729 type:complete len:520 (+) Transcript_9802:107-1666(+)|eukprot:CAMPEP_0183312632 /NCGR_PEP_ID=MMETSP0160_2-20130417/42421_1 /TAXON_ID=2839 ORGANISM="Odontella Sinensis, Strain Grunow 1884" /NCGR_SAMPLE_ID=MMETSP0160_2 /ASSEMBLY_ACC=CAM_ASM_000250 /LENGTH=519 /DNA_ID=CAMNT_0025477525 /DNA_START=34 /DNA_END=1593 /DNA_ORIENTATION=+
MTRTPGAMRSLLRLFALATSLEIASSASLSPTGAISSPAQDDPKVQTECPNPIIIQTQLTTETPTTITMTDSRFPFLSDLQRKYAHQPTFLQSVEEMALALEPLFADPEDGGFYQRAFITMTEPERIISFRVPWMDDNGYMQYNRGWRVEFNSALGPYKGGLRFHPTVDDGVLKFLGFEQIFKNALTGLPLGGGKGGSDFDPKGKSDGEVRRFCESFMTELHRYLHPSTDVPAGDIGVGGREIGYMYGQYKRLTNKHGEGVLTGKSLLFGGSPFRPEATGYGLVYIAKIAIEKKLGKTLAGARCAVSGSGNVAQYAAQKLMEFGANVITVSDSNGVLVFDNGMTQKDWDTIIEAKQVKRARLFSIEDQVTGRYVPKESPWSLNDVKYDFAFPCATQNEINAESAEHIIQNGVQGVFEGANLPTTLDGQDAIRGHPGVVYIPGKASNAGGVGVSGFEMSQNAQRLQWKPKEVDEKLQGMMANIYDQMEASSGDDGTLEQGANRAGFLKVAQAMKELGWVY